MSLYLLLTSDKGQVQLACMGNFFIDRAVGIQTEVLE